ncbi:MAG TPA: sigma factor [Acidimicrobiales bacterium]|nr:sigma factor [Acidimicrobiales bacterium]
MRRSQQGDRRAFAILAGRYDWRLRGLAYALLLDRDAMDSVVAVAYLRAWRDIVRLGAKDDVGAWLYRLTYNACIDTLRRRGDRVVADAPTGVVTGLAALPASDRLAVVLVDREGFTPESAARILGMSPAELTDRLAAVREQVAEHLPPPAPEPEAVAEAAVPPAAEPEAVEPAPAPEPEAEPEPVPEPEAVEPAPEAEPKPAAEPEPEREPEPAPAPEPQPEAVPEPQAGEPAAVEPEPADAEPAPEPAAGAEPVTVVEPEPAAEPTAEPAADAESVTVVQPESHTETEVPAPDRTDEAAEPAVAAADMPAGVATDGPPTGNGAEAAAGDGDGPRANGHDAEPDEDAVAARDANRGRGRRARRRARHAAAQRAGEGRSGTADDPRDDGQ